MLVHKDLKVVINGTNPILKTFLVFKVHGKNFEIYIVLFDLAFMLPFDIL